MNTKINILSLFALFFIHISYAMEWDPPMTKEELEERRLAYKQAQEARWQQWKDALDRAIENNDVVEFKKIFRNKEFINMASTKNDPKELLHNLYLRVHWKAGYNSLELTILRLINTGWPRNLTF